MNLRPSITALYFQARMPLMPLKEQIKNWIEMTTHSQAPLQRDKYIYNIPQAW